MIWGYLYFRKPSYCGRNLMFVLPQSSDMAVLVLSQPRDLEFISFSSFTVPSTSAADPLGSGVFALYSMIFQHSISTIYHMCPYHCIGKITSSLVSCYLKNQCLLDTHIKHHQTAALSFSNLLQLLLQIALLEGAPKTGKIRTGRCFQRNDHRTQKDTILTRYCHVLFNKDQ